MRFHKTKNHITNSTLLIESCQRRRDRAHKTAEHIGKNQHADKKDRHADQLVTKATAALETEMLIKPADAAEIPEHPLGFDDYQYAQRHNGKAD